MSLSVSVSMFAFWLMPCSDPRQWWSDLQLLARYATGQEWKFSPIGGVGLYYCLYMYVYVHVHVCVYVCMYVCIVYVYACVCVYVCECVYVCAYVCVRLCVWMCVYIYTHSSIYSSIHQYIHPLIHPLIYQFIHPLVTYIYKDCMILVLPGCGVNPSLDLLNVISCKCVYMRTYECRRVISIKSKREYNVR